MTIDNILNIRGAHFQGELRTAEVINLDDIGETMMNATIVARAPMIASADSRKRRYKAIW